MPENHWHIAEYLMFDRIKKDILKEEPQRFTEAINNLIARGFAENHDKVPGIKITREGFMMGEIIHSIEHKKYFNRYFIFNVFVWLTVWSGILIVISNALKILYNWAKLLFCL